ncbi:hypothetical protein SESBI_33134 [Sesbania bispinosa]|nr:hypothetical protein SESBI_33134 [Sesbania bispinosa]
MGPNHVMRDRGRQRLVQLEGKGEGGSDTAANGSQGIGLSRNRVYMQRCRFGWRNNVGSGSWAQCDGQ